MVLLLPLIGFAFAGCVALATVYVYQRATVTQRVARARVMPARSVGIGLRSALRTERRSKLPFIDLLPLSAVARERMETELDRAGVPLRVNEYLAIKMASGVAAVVAGAVVLQRLDISSMFPFVAFVLLLIGWRLPGMWVSRKRLQRLEAVEQQLPAALTTLAKSLRAGSGLFQAMAFTAEETPAPLGPELAQTLRELHLGASPEGAFAELSARVGSNDLDIAVTAIIIQRTVGGNLSEILANVSNTIRERAKLYGEIKVLTSRQRLTGNLIAALPVLITLLMLNMNSDLGKMLVETFPGRVAAAVGLGFELLGLFLIRQFAKIDV